MSMETLRTLCVDMSRLQARRDALEEEHVELTRKLDELRLRKIPDLMAELKLRTATFTGIGRVQLAEDLYCSTRKGMKDDAMQWLRDCGYADMIAETYNASSMKALVRQLIKDGTETPEFLNVTPFTRASIVKA